MGNVIASQERELDRKIRLSILEIMECALHMYGKTKEKKWFDEAKWFGAEAKRLAERIATHKYEI